MPTIQQLETALRNADKAGDEAAARTLAAEIRRMRAQAPAAKDAPKQKPVGRLGAFGAGFAEALPRVIATGIELLDKAGRVIGVIDENTPRASLTPAQKAAYDRQFAAARQSRPNYFTAGQITGEIAATTPVIGAAGRGMAAAGGQLARVAPRAGGVVQRVGQAVQTGGVGAGRTAAQTARMGKLARAGQLAERAAGGAIAGGAGAAMTGQDTEAGALFGAGLPVVASVLRRIGGKVGDITKLPRLKAAQIIREALGENEDAARAAFAALAPDDQRLARQVLVDAGVEPDTFMGVAADVERLRPDEVRGVLEEQAQTRAARLAQAAGGGTATERRAAAELGRRGVSEATGPAREAALSRANVAGAVVPQVEQLAAAARQEAVEQSGRARRFTLGAERAETALGQMDDLGDVFDPEAIVRQRGVAGAMAQRGEQAAQQAIGLRQAARDMEDVVADLAAEGMQPLQVAPIVQQLRSMAAQPGTRADKLQRTTLVRLANELEGLADPNGVIDARDLYQIRKTGVNDIVDRLLGSRAQPASGTKERTASLLTAIRPMIDDAIEGAGGEGWRDYLTRTRQGFEAVNRQELAAKGAQLAQESPSEFIALMRGERPQMVEDIMGKGTKQYDIGGMALADPQRYLALKQSADELATLNRMAELSRSGATAASELIGRERPFLARNLTRMGLAPFPPVRIGTEAAEMALSSLLRPRVQQELAEGVMTGRNAMALMNQYPTSLRLSEQVSTLSPGARNIIAQMLRSVIADDRSQNGYNSAP